MKNLIPTKYIPLLTLICGVLGAIFRWLLYAIGVDDRGLLGEGHLLHIACWALTLAAAAVLGLAVFPLDGSNHYKDNFSASVPGAVGAFLAAAGVLLSIPAGLREAPDTLSKIWAGLGIAAALCLIVTGVYRLMGKKPFFAFHAVVCVFFALNLANHYRGWSANPQTQDYTFPLFACIALMFSAYYHTAFEVGMGQRRMQLFSSLMGTILCCLCLAHGESPLFYLGCGAWCFLNLCPLNPPRRRRRRQQETTPETPDREVM